MPASDELAEQFSELGIEVTGEILDRCIEICVTYNINDAAEFTELWMAYAISNLNCTDVTIDLLNEFERKEFMHKNTKKAVKRSTVSHVSSAPVEVKIYGGTKQLNDKDHEINTDDIMGQYGFNTPKTNKIISGIHSASKEDVFSPITYSPMSAKSKNKIDYHGKVIYAFGSSALLQSMPDAGDSKVTVKVKYVAQQVDGVTYQTMVPDAMYMLNPILDQSRILSEWQKQVTQSIAENNYEDICPENGCDDTLDISYVGGGMTDTTIFMGTIAYEGGKERSIDNLQLIEVRNGRASKVKLDTKNLKSCYFFPGQSVVVKGRENGSHTIFPDQINYDDKKLPSAPPIKVTEPIHIYVACGPFTAADDLLYETFSKILKYYEKQRPNVIILIGPFLDEEHALISDVVLAETYQDYFEKLLSGFMDGIDINTQVLVVSSYRDAHAEPVYPTHQYRHSKNYQNLKFCSDPTVVSINGVTAGITSTDVFSHLSQTEIVREDRDKLKRWTKSLIGQGSFYPLHPPHRDVPYDHKLATKYTRLSFSPHMLIVPGDLKPFIRDINECLVLNPGRATLADGRGTFTKIVVNPPTSKDAKLSDYIACRSYSI